MSASQPAWGGPGAGALGWGWRATGPATRALVLALMLGSIGAAIAERLGLPLQSLAVLDARRVVPGLELWRLGSYLLVELHPLSLLLGGLGLWFMGGWFERRWGSAALVQFCAWAGLGAGVLAVPLTYLLDLLLSWLFVQAPGASGVDALLYAIIAAFAVVTPDTRILLGFVLPLRARTVVAVAIGLSLLFALMTGSSNLSLMLAGLLMGWLLVTGWWRPSRWVSAWRLRRPRAQAARFTVLGGRPGGTPPRYH